MTDTLIKTATLSAGDKKTVASARHRIAAINAAVHAAQPDQHQWVDGWRSRTHIAMDAALETLNASFNAENVEAYHTAFMRHEQAVLTGGTIAAAGAAALAREADVLRPIVGKVIADCLGKIDLEAARRRETLAKSDSGGLLAGDEVALLESRVSAAKAALRSELEAGNCNPLGWLDQHGIS